MTSQSKAGSLRTPVSTILTPLERSHVDAAAQGLCEPLHRESLDEVLSDLREQKADLVLISVARYGSQSFGRSEEHTSELQSRRELVCRLLLEKKNVVSSTA